MKSFEQISRELNISPKGVAKIYFRAIEKLRNNLENNKELRNSLLEILHDSPSDNLSDLLKEVLYDNYGKEREL